jgi:hypothetical protein
MSETPLCTILKGGDVLVDDLQTALELLLRPRLEPSEPGLRGPDSLDVRFEGRTLHVARLVARTRSGLRFEVADTWLVLPPPGHDQLVRVGLEWESVPVADASAVWCGQPRLRLLAAGETGADGELILARDGDGGPALVPLPADRLDGCAATAAWAHVIDALLIDADRLLGGFAA